MLWWSAAVTLLSCLVQASLEHASWGTHSLCGQLSHPSLCTSCILDHLSCEASSLCDPWCPVLDLVLVLWVLLFLSWVLCFLASICRCSPSMWSQVLAVCTVHIAARWSILLCSLFPILPYHFCILWLLDVSRLLLSEDNFPLLWWCIPVILHIGLWLLLRLLVNLCHLFC